LVLKNYFIININFDKIQIIKLLLLRINMKSKITMIYWKGEKFWLGKVLEHPEIMSQGKTIEELEENLKDAYKLMLMDDVPTDYKLKEILV